MQVATYPATMAHLAQAGALSSQYPTKVEGKGMEGKDASDVQNDISGWRLVMLTGLVSSANGKQGGLSETCQ